MSDLFINIAAMVPETEAEGPGNRFAVWVQGCPMRCPGCCNPQYLPFESSSARRIKSSELIREILDKGDKIEGITLVGGEPFSQAASLAEVAEGVRNNGLSVMAFSGFTLRELSDPANPRFSDRNTLLKQIDLLVDGRYLRELHVTDQRWIGSSNQQVHFLTDRYLDLQDNWPSGANTIEIRLLNGELTINGFPHREITRKSVALLKKGES